MLPPTNIQRFHQPLSFFNFELFPAFIGCVCLLCCFHCTHITPPPSSSSFPHSKKEKQKICQKIATFFLILPCFKVSISPVHRRVDCPFFRYSAEVTILRVCQLAFFFLRSFCAITLSPSYQCQCAVSFCFCKSWFEQASRPSGRLWGNSLTKQLKFFSLLAQ